MEKLIFSSLDKDKTTCIKCGVKKDRIRKSASLFLDGAGKRWRGKQCPECSQAYTQAYKLSHGIIKAPLKQAMCHNCTESFKQTRGNQIYCQPCKQAKQQHKRRGLPKARLACGNCGVVCARPGAKYCNKHCRASFMQKTAKVSVKPSVSVKACIWCKSAFKTAKPGIVRYCSPECVHKSKRWKGNRATRAYKAYAKYRDAELLAPDTIVKEIVKFYVECPRGYLVRLKEKVHSRNLFRLGLLSYAKKNKDQ